MEKVQKRSFLRNFILFFDSEGIDPATMRSEKVNWVRSVPFLLLHLAPLAVIWVGWSLTSVMTALAIYFIQMFMVIGFYHRYFSHKTFKTSRVVQFLSALIGGIAIQKGALWWAANHRHHHRYSDQEEDVHSPVKKGFWWSHMGWIMADKYYLTDYKYITDFSKFPELRLLNRFDVIIPVVFAALVYGMGALCSVFYPELGVTGGQFLIWGYLIPSLLSLHGTFTVNSLAHVWGSRRYETTDTSRNNLLISLVTLGEGWHNNHHRYQASARSGFYWYEVDVVFYVLKMMSWLGLVWDLKPVPQSLYNEADANKLKWVEERKSAEQVTMTAKEESDSAKALAKEKELVG